jgi:hypothetical protein
VEHFGRKLLLGTKIRHVEGGAVRWSRMLQLLWCVVVTRLQPAVTTRTSSPTRRAITTKPRKAASLCPPIVLLGQSDVCVTVTPGT